MEEIRAGDPTWQELTDPPKGATLVRLRWPATGSLESHIIEATCDETAEEWFPIGICSDEINETLVIYRLKDSIPGRRGPMRFRLVPTPILSKSY